MLISMSPSEENTRLMYTLYYTLLFAHDMTFYYVHIFHIAMRLWLSFFSFFVRVRVLLLFQFCFSIVCMRVEI